MTRARIALLFFLGAVVAGAAGGAAAMATLPGDSPGLFDYDASAPLDVQPGAPLERDGVRITDLSYASPKGGRVTSYLVTPNGPGPFAGIVFVHWGQGNRSSFLPEAMTLARCGAESLLIDAPFIRPAPWRVPGGDLEHPGADRDSYVQTVVDIRRAVDLLLSRPEVDANRIGYVGHSFGATFGGVVAGVEKRIRAFVLMAGLPRLAAEMRETKHPIQSEFLKSVPADLIDKYIAATEGLDAVHYVGRSSPAPIFFQWARFDLYISEAQAKEYEAAAGEPKSSRWYDTGHELNAVEALRDRDLWLSAQLGLGDVGALLAKEVRVEGGTATAAAADSAFTRREVVLHLPGMEEAKVRREIAYAERGGDSLKLDLYQPAAEGTGAGFPVVILVHGDAPPDAVRNAKDWGLLTSYGKLIAASGMAAVAFNHRSSEEGVRIYDAERDVADLIRYVRAHAADLGVDPGRVAVWTFSSSASYGMSAAMSDDPSWLRCLVAYYGAMDLPALRKRFPRRVLDDTLRAFSPRELLRSHPGRLPPILVTRADLDAPDLKEGVDRFVEDARARGVDVTLLTHPNGRPSFDLLDDDPKSAAIVRETLAFVAKSLGVK